MPNRGRLWFRSIIAALFLAMLGCQKLCPPGGRPIISIKPSSLNAADWRVDGNTTVAGASSVIRSDAIGNGIDFFRATPTGGSATNANKITITVTPTSGPPNNTIVIERSGAQFSWKLNGTPLATCSPCSGDGLPAEFYGTIVSITADPMVGSPITSVGLAEMHAQ